MAILTDSQIDDYCNRHLPYIRGVMLAHYVLIAKGPYKDDARILNATFLGSLIAGRMILEFLGVGLEPSTMQAKRPVKKNDSVWIDDLGGELVQIASLRSESAKHEYLRVHQDGTQGGWSSYPSRRTSMARFPSNAEDHRRLVQNTNENGANPAFSVSVCRGNSIASNCRSGCA